MKALPSTCTGMEWVQGEGLQMRLQLTADENGAECITEEGKDEGSGDPLVEALDQPQCVVVCARCGALLLYPPGGFNKVLPLPSGDWSEMAEDMWCCKSKIIAHDRGKMTPIDLTLDEGVVMVGDLHLLVSSRGLRKGSVRIEKRVSRGQPQSINHAVKSLCVFCQRCNCIVGSITAQGASIQLETTRLHRYAVSVARDELEASRKLYRPLECTISRLMVALFKSQMTFKFIVERDEDHKTQLLLWLLGIDIILLQNDAPSADANLPGVVTSQSPSPSTCSLTSHQEASNSGTTLRKWKIIKILYQTCNNEQGQRLATEWNRDLMVHGITLTTEACLELGLLLATSTQNAPHSMRQMNGYMVGSLRL